MLESNSVVAGGGAVETALSIYLDDFATTLGSREQLAIAEFADALLVIPKTLSVNAAQDATDLIGKLRAYHSTAQQVCCQPKINLRKALIGFLQQARQCQTTRSALETSCRRLFL